MIKISPSSENSLQDYNPSLPFPCILKPWFFNSYFITPLLEACSTSFFFFTISLSLSYGVSIYTSFLLMDDGGNGLLSVVPPPPFAHVKWK